MIPQTPEERFKLKLKRYGEILLHMLTEKEHFSTLYPEEENEYEILLKELKMMLITNPGMLITSGLDAKLVKTLVEIVWNHDEDDFEWDVYGGDEADFGLSLVHDYLRRVKKLRPIVVSLDPELLPFKVHLQEAVRCYAHELDTASFILIASVLESALRERLMLVDSSYELKFDEKNRHKGVGPVTFIPLIKLAYDEGIINLMNKTKLIEIGEIRNDAVHKARVITAEETVKALEECVRILQFLYKK